MVNVKDISFSYSRGGNKVLDGVGFDIEDGNCIAILGTNGAGKSTLLKCMDKICHTRGSTVLVDGSDVFKMNGSKRAQSIAYVRQNSEPVEMTVFDTVMLGRKPYIKFDSTREDKRIVSELISDMGLDDYILRNVSELSGGEAQKVMLAMALAQQPRLLLLDEPTSNLDPHNQHEVLRTVKRIAKQHNICVAMVIHDLNLAVRYCERFLFLKDANIYAYGGYEVITPENFENVYNIHVHIIDYMGVPVIVPFPDEAVFDTQHDYNAEASGGSETAAEAHKQI